MKRALAMAAGALMLASGCGKSDKQNVSRERQPADAPWPFGKEAAAVYEVRESRDGLGESTHRRTVEVGPSGAHGMMEAVMRMDGREIRKDYYLLDGDVVKWAGFQDLARGGDPVRFKSAVPMFSATFKGGERCSVGGRLTVTVVGWSDVPLSSGKIRACKTRIDYQEEGAGFTRLMWYAPAYGVVFEDAKYYRGDKLARHETATLISVNADGAQATAMPKQ